MASTILIVLVYQFTQNFCFEKYPYFLDHICYLLWVGERQSEADSTGNNLSTALVKGHTFRSSPPLEGKKKTQKLEREGLIYVCQYSVPWCIFFSLPPSPAVCVFVCVFSRQSIFPNLRVLIFKHLLQLNSFLYLPKLHDLTSYRSLVIFVLYYRYNYTTVINSHPKLTLY